MLVTFLIYVYPMGQPLTANTAFVTLALFNIVRAPLNILPMLVAFLVQASVSVKRIARFLNHGDIDLSSISHDKDDDHPIKMENCNMAWNLEYDASGAQMVTLRNIDFKVKSGSLTAVVGAVGSGKSSLVTSLLGDLNKLSGRINVDGKVAYVAQQAWIQNLTLRDNILFGKEFLEDKYDTVLEACALKPDLEILPGGDKTEIGEKGINLSGGQKQRVNIARAVYQNSDIYLFDDPLSAVDSHVGKHLFDRVVGPEGVLKNKTRVLVTHGLGYLKNVDHVVFMKDGRIEAQGSFQELMVECEAFRSFANAANLPDEDREEYDLEKSDRSSRTGSQISHLSDIDPRERTASQIQRSNFRQQERIRKRRLMRSISVVETEHNELFQLNANARDAQDKDREREKEDEGKLIEVEVAQEGNISVSVFVDYIKAIGVKIFILSAFLFLAYQASAIGAQIWLSSWSDWTQKQIDEWPDNYTLDSSRQNEYVGIYSMFGGLQAGFILAYGLIFSVALVKASAKLHWSLLDNILRCPMSFFDSVPSGRILNRFSKDVEVTDNTLPQTVRSFFATAFTCVQIFILISYSSPIFLVFLIPLCGFYYFVQRFYVKTSRQLKRVESTTRSPIFNHFSESLTGTSVIRAYGAESRFINDIHARVDENNIYYYSGSIVAARWLGIRLEFLGSLIVLAASLLAVLSRNDNSGTVGLAVSSSLQITGSLNWSVRMMSDLETYIVSVERIKEYTQVENEALWEIPANKPSKEWPRTGNLKFTDYSTRYRRDLDLVLNQISFMINSGEKVGIVGRTGAGKSSLTLALFRIIEAANGKIELDNIEIARLGLHDLRKKITILPQDPVLFSGSLRVNLDPFDEYNDGEIWKSLENAHLKDFVMDKQEKLEYDVGENGSNLSVGQRQLVCLARALLHKTMILILDEATAAVDLQTDELIQDTIKVQFKECTVLAIAHRLNTILNYDRVMVLSEGKIKEYDNPQTLLADPTTQFYSMALSAGLVGQGDSNGHRNGSGSSGEHKPQENDDSP